MRMYNANNRKDLRRAEKDLAARDRQRVDFIVAAMSTLQGRAWFHDLLAHCHIFADPFTGDALVEAYSKGERNVGLKIYNDIVSNCPDHFVAMMREASIKDLANDRSNDDADSDPSALDDPDGSAASELTGSEDTGRDVEGSGLAGFRDFDDIYGAKPK